MSTGFKLVQSPLVILALICITACGGGSYRKGSSSGASGEWAWMSGSNFANQTGSYGTLGTSASTNVPGAREQAISWTDNAGNFWLFGGDGYDSVGTNGFLNDLWIYGSAGQWTWIGGSNIANQPGDYGSLRATAPNNIPGARNSEVRWIDSSGNLWLFGGGGYDANGTLGPLNDLWENNGAQWTWMGGSNLASQPGVYGNEGTASPSNIPGARFHAVGWKDTAGNFWLFGGNVNALNASGDIYMNDLWEYSAGQWAWVGGSDQANQAGTYGTMGTAAANNIPGAREQAFAWTDTGGNFWLFGGNGYDSTGSYGFLNDLWEYSTTTKQWTWVGGSSTANQAATYGTEGTAAASNIPGSRNSGINWIDTSGNVWLFGGGDAPGSSVEYFNDMWKYSASEWTWVSGSNEPDQSGMYGTIGTASSNNIPGCRTHEVGWVDSSGNLWLFGGYAYDSTGIASYLNDLWKYEPAQ